MKSVRSILSAVCGQQQPCAATPPALFKQLRCSQGLGKYRTLKHNYFHSNFYFYIYKEHYWELPTSVLYFCVFVIYENYNTTSKQEKIMDLPINYPFHFLFFSLYSHQCFPHIHLLVPHTSVNSMM